MTSTGNEAAVPLVAPRDIESGGVEQHLDDLPPTDNRIVVTDVESYPGSNIGEKIDSAIDLHSIFIVSKSTCPFCRDVKDLLADQIGLTIHSVEVNEHPDGGKIFAYAKSKTGKMTVPQVFIKGKYVGGCDDVKALHHKGLLEDEIKGLVNKARTAGTDKLETSHLVPVERSKAINPLFWFPNTVNNYVIRVVGFQVFVLSVLSAVFYDELWAHWLAAFLAVDFTLRMLAGASASPLGMIGTLLTSPFRPQFRPGPPKQFAGFCGLMFSGLATIFYFLDFEGHEYIGLAFIAGLAGASGLEWALDFCLGCKFYAIGIYLGLIPDHVYRIYTSSRQEIEDSWDYMFLDSNAPPSVPVDTDPKSPIALKYKKKTDEFSKDDFDLIRHMQVAYFAMPLSLVGLAVAFKIASDWTNSISEALGVEERDLIADDGAYQALATVAFAVFAFMLILYSLRLIMYTSKCTTEWHCPIRSNSFAMIPLCFMLHAFLLYDEIEYDEDNAIIGDEENPQVTARVLFWMGAIAQAVLTIAKFGEWLARRLELEHVYPHWIAFPVGLSVAALVAPIIPMFAADSDHADGVLYLARFFQSFALFMFLVLFIVTFFKTVTTHNSNDSVRYGVFMWLAASSILGLSDFVICFFSPHVLEKGECVDSLSNYYFISIFIFLGILYASLPSLGFLGKDKWGMHYWIGCFALDALAAAAAMFYAVTDFNAAQTLAMIAICMATVANTVNFLHFATGMIRRRGVFTPQNRWGPLSFMKLTHEAFRGNMNTLQGSFDALDLDKDTAEMRDNINMFAAHLNRFSILHEEHSKHEDEVIFKQFNDWFHDHAKHYNDDHDDFHATMSDVEKHANTLLSPSLSLDERKNALASLKSILPPFFESFAEHLKGEEDNLNPIGKILPVEIQKQISREVWNVTTAERWEIVIPFVINNLPRHLQRVRYLKVLLWSMPERAHQIGAIVYRNVTAVMWERLINEVPEMAPRGDSRWWRYY